MTFSEHNIIICNKNYVQKIDFSGILIETGDDTEFTWILKGVTPKKLKKQILSNQKLRRLVEDRINQLEAIPKNNDDFLFTRFNIEIRELKELLDEAEKE